VPEIPVPPAVTLPEAGRPIVTKKPLAWRAKALAMSGEYPFNEKNGAVWVLPIAYDKGQNLLKQAINQSGLEILAEYPDAGQYLISVPGVESNPTDKSVGARFIRPYHGDVIIVCQPAGETKTLFKLRIYGNTQTTDSKKIYALPSLMKELFENRQLWQ
jgi:hypothetical protein